MSERRGWPSAILGIRRRIAWAAAWYRSVRTTFAVIRLLDRETHFASSSRSGPSSVSSRRRRRFVARTGYIV